MRTPIAQPIKRESLKKLKRDLGGVVLRDLTRERLIAFGKARGKEGAGPVTLGMELGYIRTVKWLRNFERLDKWIVCLTARTIVRANQERR